jgi:protease YdgD
MMRVFLIILFSLVGFGAWAQSSGLRALDKENDARGWEAVGRLDTDRGFCTATLISPTLLLSAAHCVYDRQGRMIPADKFQFRAGFRKGEVAAERKIARLVAHSGFNPRAPLTPQNASHDVALLELSAPISSTQINPFVLHSESVRPGPVSIVSYGRGRDQVQSREDSCRLTRRVDTVLLFNCDVTFGSSGSPVFSHLNGRGRILSVISGMMHINGEKVAIGMHLPSLVSTLKRELRAGQSKPTAKMRRLSVGQSGSGGAKFVKAPTGG